MYVPGRGCAYVWVCVCEGVRACACENISCHIDKFSTFIIWCVNNALREVTISLIRSVHMKQCASHRTDFRGMYYLGRSTKICPTSVVVKSVKNKKYLREDVEI